MAITRTPIVDDDGSGTTGTVIDNAWKQQFYDQIDGALLAGNVGDPAWVAVPWVGGNFSATGGWTVSAANQVYYRYRRIGKTCFIALYLSNTTLAASSADLNINLPTVAPAGGEHLMHVSYYHAGTMSAGQTALATAYLNAATPLYLRVRRDYFATAWTAGSIYLVINDSYPIP